MQALTNITRMLERSLHRNFSSSAHQMVVVGAVAFLAFPLFYWIWTSWYPLSDEMPEFRFVGSVLGLGLMLTPYWPIKARRFIPMYWFLTLLYVLPFFFAYSFLLHRADDLSSMTLLCAVFLLVLLVDVYSLSLLLFLGFGLAFVSYVSAYQDFYFSQEHVEVAVVLMFVIIAGSTVNYKTAILQRQKMDGVAAAAGMIAHELRTPLLSIKSGAQAMQAYTPTLIEGYQIAKEHGLLSSNMRSNRILQLEGVNERIVREIDYANTIIDMLLMKTGREHSLQSAQLELCSMADCMAEAMERYPFRSESARQLVHCMGDFQFMGSKLLMQHVIFNLLKNALYMIATVQKGEIKLWTTQKARWNYLHFEDTAKGMTPKQLSKLFDHFYTTTFMGTGIGLSFCKMVMKRFGGDIFCESEAGNYTKFTLSFPAVSL